MLHVMWPRLGGKIGSGQFGEVHRGTWVSPKGKVEVALKTLKKGATCQEKVKFLQEVAIMAQFKHPCVVTMHGVITKEEPVRLHKFHVVFVMFKLCFFIR